MSRPAGPVSTASRHQVDQKAVRQKTPGRLKRVSADVERLDEAAAQPGGRYSKVGLERVSRRLMAVMKEMDDEEAAGVNNVLTFENLPPLQNWPDPIYVAPEPDSAVVEPESDLELGIEDARTVPIKRRRLRYHSRVVVEGRVKNTSFDALIRGGRYCGTTRESAGHALCPRPCFGTLLLGQSRLKWGRFGLLSLCLGFYGSPSHGRTAKIARTLTTTKPKSRSSRYMGGSHGLLAMNSLSWLTPALSGHKIDGPSAPPIFMASFGDKAPQLSCVEPARRVEDRNSINGTLAFFLAGPSGGFNMAAAACAVISVRVWVIRRLGDFRLARVVHRRLRILAQSDL